MVIARTLLERVETTRPDAFTAVLLCYLLALRAKARNHPRVHRSILLAPSDICGGHVRDRFAGLPHSWQLGALGTRHVDRILGVAKLCALFYHCMSNAAVFSE